MFRIVLLPAVIFWLAVQSVAPVTASAQDARIAIVDSSESVAEIVAQLADAGVSAVGRYYSRCPQPRQAPHKRMIDNLDEVDALLKDGRFGILSVYQFFSQDDKFDPTRTQKPPTEMDRRPRKTNPETVADFSDCVMPDRPNTIEEDARFDGYAAVTQAEKIIHQPKGTAIYFGVDCDLKGLSRENVLAYFRVVNAIVKNAGYKAGVYGNGAVADLLYSADDPAARLVDYVWLNASAGHQGSVDTYNDRHWDLFQTKTDTNWMLRGKTASLDTDLQNPASRDVGAWFRKGSFRVPQDRNTSVLDARRFVCEGSPLVTDDAGSPLQKNACAFGAVVRVFETDARKNRMRVDCNEDGVPDGWMSIGDLSKKRPAYVYDSVKRSQTHCVVRR